MAQIDHMTTAALRAKNKELAELVDAAWRAYETASREDSVIKVSYTVLTDEGHEYPVDVDLTIGEEREAVLRALSQHYNDLRYEHDHVRDVLIPRLEQLVDQAEANADV